MDIIISDLPEAAAWVGADSQVITADGSGSPCTGCFGCWIRTPGRCVICDGLHETGPRLGRADRLILVSRCCFGSLSPAVKKVLDRSISYMHPYFEIRAGTMHHTMRYSNRLRIHAFLYGPSTEAEQRTAAGILAANTLNLNAVLERICFIPEAEFVKEAMEQ